MARAADHAGIQFRTLNASKGPAVRATRAQADRQRYRQFIRHAPGRTRRTCRCSSRRPPIWSSRTDRFKASLRCRALCSRRPAVVLTVGTFLGGRIHVGLNQYAGGRAGDPPSNRLAERLRALELRVGRLKTGTPPRIDGRTIDYSVLQAQPGDVPVPVFSFLGRASDHPRQVDCFITATNERTHEIIRQATDRSPMFTGVIEGVGPRYCPSVEGQGGALRGQDLTPGLRRARGLILVFWIPTRCTRTGFQPACHSMCSTSWCAVSGASKRHT